MADVRSLLRSHQQAASTSRISHPLASYTAAGSLRCVACGIPIQPRAWEGHVVSKQHRKRAAAIRSVDSERKGKRKELGDGERAGEGEGREKRRRVSEDVEMMDEEAEPSGMNGAAVGGAGGGGLPAGFFSDPTRTLARESSPEEEEAEPSAPNPAAAEPAPVSQTSAPATTAVDLELDAFLKDLASAPPPPVSDVYARATVFAEPEMAEPELPEGFPEELAPKPPTANGASGGLNLPTRRPGRAVQTATGAPPAEEEETEDQKRERKEQDERELIMDRMMEEERVQEEADERVESLRGRVEALKRMRRERMGKGR